MFMMVVCINTVPALPVDLETQNNQLSDALMLEQLGIGPEYYLTNRQYGDDDNINDDGVLIQKRQLKRKWTAFHRGVHSPYTIAFPALIRTRQ
jgi:hypothetical protein